MNKNPKLDVYHDLQKRLVELKDNRSDAQKQADAAAANAAAVAAAAAAAAKKKAEDDRKKAAKESGRTLQKFRDSARAVQTYVDRVDHAAVELLTARTPAEEQAALKNAHPLLMAYFSPPYSFRADRYTEPITITKFAARQVRSGGESHAHRPETLAQKVQTLRDAYDLHAHGVALTPGQKAVMDKGGIAEGDPIILRKGGRRRTRKARRRHRRRKTRRRRKRRKHPKKRQASKTRKGRLDFVTHKGDKAYNRSGHRQYRRHRPYRRRTRRRRRH